MPRDAAAQPGLKDIHFLDIDPIAGRQQNMIDAPRAAIQRQGDTIAVAARVYDAGCLADRYVLQAGPQPKRRSGTRAVFVQPVAQSLRQIAHPARRLDQPVERKRPDLRRRDQRVAKQRTYPLAQCAAFVRVSVPRELTPANDLDVGARLMQQRRRLAGALAAADDRNSAPAETIGVGVFAGMADQSARQPVEWRRPVLVMQEAGCHHYALGKEAFAVIEEETKAAVAERDSLDNPAAVEIRRHPFLEPHAVADEIFDRQPVRQRPAGLAEI